MRKILAAFAALTMVFGASALLAPSANAAPTKVHKSYVCKYVGTPGENERLQTGNNPIFVDNNSITKETGKDTVSVGDEFADKQGRSVVIVANTLKLDPEPTIKDCPAPDNPNDPVTALDLTPVSVCGEVDTLVIPETDGFVYVDQGGTLDPGTLVGPGTEILTAEAEEGYYLTDPDWTQTIVLADRTDENCIPTKDDKVVVGEWVDGTYECDDTTVEQTREVTTTSYVWDAEMQDFFVKDITVVTETQTRDLTADEQTACPTDKPDPKPEPKPEPPAELPGTGGSLLPLAGALGLLALGAGALAASRRRSNSLV
jgi:LPXTG-motif cell wall-anchored protein